VISLPSPNLGSRARENKKITLWQGWPRYAPNMSALKIVGLCKRKISRRLRMQESPHYNLITIRCMVKLFLKCSNQCDQGTKTLQTDRQTYDLLWHHLVVKLGRQNVADIIGIADI